MTLRPPSRLAIAAVLSLSTLLVVAPARGQLAGDRPDELKNVGIDPKLGDKVPLDLKFRDESGKVIMLGDIFTGERPVLLSLNYSDCPMLCRVQLDGLFDTLKQMDWNLGEQYELVSVSINPLETPARAKQTEKKYLERYGRAGAASGLRFLVSREKNIRKLADSVGFKYQYVPDTQEYAHTAAIMVMTPDGVVSRYFYGVAYDPQTLRLSMVEAAEGQVGSLTDQILLFCFHYDEAKGKYGPAAQRIMSIGAGFTILVLAVGLVPFWLRRSTGGAAKPVAQPTDTGSVLGAPVAPLPVTE